MIMTGDLLQAVIPGITTIDSNDDDRFLLLLWQDFAE